MSTVQIDSAIHIRLIELGGRLLLVRHAMKRLLYYVRSPDRSTTPRPLYVQAIIWISFMLISPPVLAQGLLSAPETSNFLHPQHIVETEWLSQHLHDENVRVVDLRTAIKFHESHIPGAVNLTRGDLRTSSDPHFLLSVDQFEKLMISKGISNDHWIVAYDDRGGMDPAWFWWMLRYFGHEKAAILNGGWQKWISESQTINSEGKEPEPSSGFQANIHSAWIATADELMELLGNPGLKVIDGRTRKEFEGNVEGWENLYGDRHGRIPYAMNVVWSDILNSDGTFKSSYELRQHFESKGIYHHDHVISYCLGGMRSSANIFALYQAGYRNIVLYHGSWWDWGERYDLPVEIGAVETLETDK
jgi:thiosulfate/3-mercaptopyruvate sulfurtransferase